MKNFGVNLTRLMPGGESALLHRHSKQDEFIYILQGEPTLVTETAEISSRQACARASPRPARRTSWSTATSKDVLYLEVGDRTPGDEGSYPKDDLQAVLGADGKWVFTRNDGRPY